MNQNFPLHTGDALLVVDIQNDFCPGGALGVPEGDQVIPELNRWIELAVQHDIPVLASRDWHPADHISFKERGGPWPPHCIQGTRGAEFHPALKLPANASVISKATKPDQEGYSAFDGGELLERLRALNIRSIWIGGLALDYCVRATTLDARRLGYEVHVLEPATRAVNVHPDDGPRALKEIEAAGAIIEHRSQR